LNSFYRLGQKSLKKTTKDENLKKWKKSKIRPQLDKKNIKRKTEIELKLKKKKSE
jgi:hypothetical protein